MNEGVLFIIVVVLPSDILAVENMERCPFRYFRQMSLKSMQSMTQTLLKTLTTKRQVCWTCLTCGDSWIKRHLMRTSKYRALLMIWKEDIKTWSWCNLNSGTYYKNMGLIFFLPKYKLKVRLKSCLFMHLDALHINKPKVYPNKIGKLVIFFVFLSLPPTVST